MLRPLIVACLAACSACSVNPVTGSRELSFVSAEQEIAIGQSQFLPSRQMQGGDYTVDPDLNDYVSEVGQRVAAMSDRDLPYEFVVLNSSVPNAWALPGGKIAINRGLLVELESEAELAAVLGHEIVHAAARHGAQAMTRGMLAQGALVTTAVVVSDSDYSDLALGAAGIGAQLVNQRYGRSAELESDLYGMQYMSRAGYDPQAAVSLQETFLRLSEGRGDPGAFERLLASHPPSAERVERNRETASSLPPGGELGTERYAAATSRLRASLPAYEAYEDGLDALAEDRWSDAERLGNEALELVPTEGHFHALLGDTDIEQGNFEAGIEHFSDAIAVDDQYFYYPLRRGIARQRANQLDLAEADLETSIALLPTANAFLSLGSIAEQRGDRQGAITQYGRAAGSSSEAGREAQDRLARLELAENPGKYVGVRTGLDQGQLIVEVVNTTRLTITNVVLLVRYADSQGAIRTRRLPLNQRLGPGAAQRIATGLGPFQSTQQYEVAIESAAPVS